MDVRELRGWLLCQPRPTKLRVVAGDAQEHRIEVTAGMQWIQLAQSVAALQPDLVEALDDKGNLLRAVRPSEVSEDEEPADNTSLSQDPENARLITFAKLLADAYKHSTETAFDKLASLFEAVNRRSEAQERTIVTMERVQRKMFEDLVLQQAEGAQSGGGTLMEQMMAAFLQGQQQSAAAPKPNGVAKPKKPPEEAP
jgi:hypothetical protein